MTRPVEEVVQQSLLLGHKGIQLIDQNDAKLRGLAFKAIAMGSAESFGRVSLIKDLKFVLFLEEFIEKGS